MSETIPEDSEARTFRYEVTSAPMTYAQKRALVRSNTGPLQGLMYVMAKSEAASNAAAIRNPMEGRG